MISIIYIAFPNIETATQVSNQLVKEGLVACTNIFPIQSCYIWQANFCNDNEFVALVKTMPPYTTKVEEYILAHHPYELPCIIHWQAQANEKYEAWVSSCLNPDLV